MIYVMLIICLFSVILLVHNYAYKYTFYLLIMGISLTVTLFVAVLSIAKLGNYKYPSNVLYLFDYAIFLRISKIKISYYNIARIMNIGMGTYIAAVALFSYQFTHASRRLLHAKWMKQALLLLLPLFYVWFHDPQTNYSIYLLLNERFVNAPQIAQRIDTLLVGVNVFNYVWIIAYLFFPMVWFLQQYRATTVKLKKKQHLSLMVCLCCLNLFFVMTVVAGISRPSYLSAGTASSALLNIPRMMFDELYSYEWFSFIMLIMMMVILYLITHYGSMGPVNYFNDFLIKRNTKGLNKNMQSFCHSFKNTLFTIKILAAQWELDPQGEQGAEARDRLKTVVDESLVSMTKMLNSFNKINLRVERENVAEMTDRALGRVQIPPNIQIVRNYGEADFVARLDNYHFIEALINIIQNACEAIEKAQREQGRIAVELWAEHEWLVLKIGDNGTGIKKKELNKIFKPFFTTKSLKNNWGIGLSYTFRVIKAHLGFITVDSVCGEGTTFQILLPNAKEE